MEPVPDSKSSSSLETNHKSESKGKEEYWTLTGKNPFFDIIVSKSNLHPNYQLAFPSKMHSVIPFVYGVPAILKHRGKEWHMVYRGKMKRFGIGWRNFATDNDLKLGDAVIFELVECSSTKLVLRVQILSGETPPEMLEKSKPGTGYPDSPIIIP